MTLTRVKNLLHKFVWDSGGFIHADPHVYQFRLRVSAIKSVVFAQNVVLQPSFDLSYSSDVASKYVEHLASFLLPFSAESAGSRHIPHRSVHKLKNS